MAMGSAVDKESLDVNKRHYIMKNLKSIVNEALKDQKKVEVMKGIEIIFNNTRDPEEALEFLYDLVEAVYVAVSDKAKYVSSSNPNHPYWEDIAKELKKPLDNLSDDIEELQRRGS